MKPDSEEPELFPELDADEGVRAAFRWRDSSSAKEPRASAAEIAPRDERRGYVVREEIARGGMGLIVKAFDRGLERDVALKLLRDELTDEPRCVRRFMEEARVTARLDHPGIVPVHEVGHDADGHAYFAMRLVRGRDLRQVIELANRSEQGWNQTRCLTVILRVCEAMAYAHDKGVLHRDLKPSNVMVGAFGEVYVMDWGLARELGRADAHDLRLRVQASAGTPTRAADRARLEGDESDAKDVASINVESPIVTMDGEVLGTPCYMPPEQAQGRVGELGPRADVYSVGAMLYHLLAGEMPYVPAGTTAVSRAVLRRVVEGPPRPLHEIRGDIPAELIAISERAMARDPAQRYASMLAMAEDLRAFLEGRVVQAHQTGALAEFKKWVQRNKGLSAASGAALLALMLGLIASLVLKSQSDRNAELALTNATVAKKNEDTATARADDVFRLSALQDLDDLTAEAQELWPSDPALVPRYDAWIARAQALVDELPEHEAKLAELRARALAWTSAEAAAARARHPRFAVLEAGRRTLERYRRQFAALEAPNARTAGSAESADGIGTDSASLAETWRELDAIARPLVDPEREQEGGEAKGLLLAERAVARAAALPPPERAEVHDTLAWALFANQRFAEALEMERRASQEAEPAQAARFQSSLAAMQRLVDASIGPERREKQRAWLAEREAVLREIEAEVSARAEWSFADTQDRWWHGQLTKLINGLKALVEPEHGLLSPTGVSPEHGWSIAKRRDFARTIETRSVSGAEAAARWSEALAAIRDATKCPQYGGLVLAPQLGLLPIGPDPDSGLWEFAHLQTGEPAKRGADGKLALDDAMGIVLVLLPAGVFQMGAQKIDRNGPNYDPAALEIESPVHEVTVSPCFMSKYEMTQGQWQRFTGRNPSLHGPAYYFKDWSRSHRAWSELHPVEEVSWLDCTKTLKRARLELPTEAQWEYACRAGTSSVFWPGDAKESLRGVANLSDAYGKTHGNQGWQVWEAWLDDGETLHAEIGSYWANPFGLHDVHGNVGEWCQDVFARYGEQVKVGEGDRVAAEYHLARGGAFAGLAATARSAFRDLSGSGLNATDSIGVRPARSIAP